MVEICGSTSVSQPILIKNYSDLRLFGYLDLRVAVAVNATLSVTIALCVAAAVGHLFRAYIKNCFLQDLRSSCTCSIVAAVRPNVRICTVVYPAWLFVAYSHVVMDHALLGHHHHNRRRRDVFIFGIFTGLIEVHPNALLPAAGC
jgi:hypothetical protein